MPKVDSVVNQHLTTELQYQIEERACIKHFDANEPWEDALRHAREEQEGGFLPLRATQDESEHPRR